MNEPVDPSVGLGGDEEALELRGLGRGAVPPADLERRVLDEVRRRESVGFAIGFAWGSLGAILHAILEVLGGVFDPDPDTEEER